MNIMIGYHGFSLDGDIIKTALVHAAAFKARIHLATSVQVGEDIPKMEFDRAEEWLETGKAFFMDQGIHCVGHLLETGREVGEDLVQFALENDINELIIGVRNRSKLGKLIFGSTAQYVILNAPCPVLCIRNAEE